VPSTQQSEPHAVLPLAHPTAGSGIGVGGTGVGGTGGTVAVGFGTVGPENPRLAASVAPSAPAPAAIPAPMPNSVLISERRLRPSARPFASQSNLRSSTHALLRFTVIHARTPPLNVVCWVDVLRWSFSCPAFARNGTTSAHRRPKHFAQANQRVRSAPVFFHIHAPMMRFGHRFFSLTGGPVARIATCNLPRAPALPVSSRQYPQNSHLKRSVSDSEADTSPLCCPAERIYAKLGNEALHSMRRMYSWTTDGLIVLKIPGGWGKPALGNQRLPGDRGRGSGWLAAGRERIGSPSPNPHAQTGILPGHSSLERIPVHLPDRRQMRPGLLPDRRNLLRQCLMLWLLLR